MFDHNNNSLFKLCNGGDIQAGFVEKNIYKHSANQSSFILFDCNKRID